MVSSVTTGNSTGSLPHPGEQLALRAQSHAPLLVLPHPGLYPPPPPEKSLKCPRDPLRNASTLLQRADQVPQPLSLGSMTSPRCLPWEIHIRQTLRTPTMSLQLPP